MEVDSFYVYSFFCSTYECHSRRSFGMIDLFRSLVRPSNLLKIVTNPSLLRPKQMPLRPSLWLNHNTVIRYPHVYNLGLKYPLLVISTRALVRAAVTYVQRNCERL